MIFLRPIKLSDFDALVNLSQAASLGITNLPKDPKLLEKKILDSVDSFKKRVFQPDKELYFFVLEDTEEKTIIGTSAIYATTGGGEPLYFYRRQTENVSSPLSHVVKTQDLLVPVSYVRGPSELCSLFLHPQARKHGLGKLLSLGRFLFIAAFPMRFTNSFFAELRGVIENDTSPFWEAVGKHFLDVSFADALELLNHGRSFIAEFLPKHPIYISLLPQSAQAAIGQTHPNTAAAAAILKSLGFKKTNDIDIFEAGPKLCALKNTINAISESHIATVKDIQEKVEGPLFIAGNEQIDYRACLDSFKLVSPYQVIISKEVAASLQIERGSQIRLFALPHKEGK